MVTDQAHSRARKKNGNTKIPPKGIIFCGQDKKVTEIQQKDSKILNKSKVESTQKCVCVLFVVSACDATAMCSRFVSVEISKTCVYDHILYGLLLMDGYMDGYCMVHTDLRYFLVFSGESQRRQTL